VIQDLEHGLTVNLLAPLSQIIHDRRKLIGLVLLAVGIGSVFAHQFLFDMYEEPHDVCRVLHFSESQCYSRITREGWCYMSWFYYYETIRFCVAAIFLTLSGFLFMPKGKGVAIIIFSALHGAAWTGLFHYTLFVESHETYHMLPHWHFIVFGLSLGIGIILSADYFAYWEHHKKRGNWQKWPAIFRSTYSQEEKNKLFEMADKEYEQVNRMI
jgi:hypothetical protein